MGPSHILVVDDDPWIQRMVAAVLGQRGHAVDCVDTLAQARAVLARAVPALLIVARTLSDGRGDPFVAGLRRAGQLEAVPVLLLADAGTDRPVPSTELDAVLAKPLRVEDLESAVNRALERRASSIWAEGRRRVPTPPPPVQEPPPLPAAAVEGDIGAIGLPTVLLLLDMERKTGALHLSGAEGEIRSAELVVRKGRVIRAHVFEGDATASGAEAVYQTLGWTEGWFSFHPVDMEGPDEIQASTTFLLMESARRADAEAEDGGDPGEKVDV